MINIADSTFTDFKHKYVLALAHTTLLPFSSVTGFIFLALQCTGGAINKSFSSIIFTAVLSSAHCTLFSALLYCHKRQKKFTINYFVLQDSLAIIMTRKAEFRSEEEL